MFARLQHGHENEPADALDVDGRGPHTEHLLDALRCQYVARRPKTNGFTLVKCENIVTVSGGEVEIVENEDRRLAGVFDQLQKIELNLQIEVVRRLVEEQKIRVLGKRPGNRHPLPLTA